MTSKSEFMSKSSTVGNFWEGKEKYFSVACATKVSCGKLAKQITLFQNSSVVGGIAVMIHGVGEKQGLPTKIFYWTNYNWKRC